MQLLSRITKPLSIFVILAIIGLSYRGLAPQFSPTLNSDFAVHILMTHDLQLPDDLYYWGQDRLGSLVPILSHFALKMIPLAPVKMVGIMTYVMALVAYLCFASFLREAASWVLLAAAWFLPLRLYVEFLEVGPPYAAQFACLGLATVGMRWLLYRGSLGSSWQRHLVITLTMFSMTASLWVSTFSIIYLMAVLGAIAHHLWFRLSAHQRRAVYAWSIADGITVGIAGALGFGFLQLAKASAANSYDYLKFNTLAQFWDYTSRMGQSFGRNLRFEGLGLWFSIAAWLMSGIVLYALYLLYRHRRAILRPAPSQMAMVDAANGAPNDAADDEQAIAQTPSKTQRPSPSYPIASPLQPLPMPPQLWLGSWGLTNGLGMIALLLAHWVYQPDHIPQRYFVVIYVLGWLTILFLGEQVPKRSRLILWGLLLPLTIANIMSLPPRAFANQHRPRIEQLAELQSLAPASFIGDYWHSYILCSADPDLFHCTPYDGRGKIRCPKGAGQPYRFQYQIGSVVRCQRCVEAVLNSPAIYLVQQRWFKRFPKRIEQFGYCLERSGKPFEVAGHKMAPYRKLE
ncbi:MAG: hypothetical protein F6K30_23795 [Cyanothece sp. SIO2G6]|nr:hypothetical protein [Cyanothece sp. SIO2G6]